MVYWDLHLDFFLSIFRTIYGLRCKMQAVAAQPKPFRCNLTPQRRKCVRYARTSLKFLTQRTTPFSSWWMKPHSSWPRTLTRRGSRPKCTAAHSHNSTTLCTARSKTSLSLQTSSMTTLQPTDRANLVSIRSSRNSFSATFIQLLPRNTAYVCIVLKKVGGKWKMCLEGNREGRMCLTDAAFFMLRLHYFQNVLGSGTRPSQENSCTQTANVTVCLFISSWIFKHIQVSRETGAF